MPSRFFAVRDVGFAQDAASFREDEESLFQELAASLSGVVDAVSFRMSLCEAASS